MTTQIIAHLARMATISQIQYVIYVHLAVELVYRVHSVPHVAIIIILIVLNASLAVPIASNVFRVLVVAHATFPLQHLTIFTKDYVSHVMLMHAEHAQQTIFASYARIAFI